MSVIGHGLRVCLLAAGFAVPVAAQSPPPAPSPTQTPTQTPTQAPTQQGPVPVPAPTPIQPAWVTRATAELQVLDKVNARTTTLSVAVGQRARYGALEIAPQACSSRPADQAPDAAAFLVISDTRSGQVAFRGWMFAANPALAMLEHPIYDVRVLACR